VALGPTLSYPRDTEALLPPYSEGEIKDLWSFTFLVFRVALGPTISYPRDNEALLPPYSEGEIKDLWSFTFPSPLILS